MVAANLSKIRKEAGRLARANKDAEPNIKIIYWFPHDVEIRLVEVEENTVPTMSGELEPFYFSAAPKEGIRSASAIAIIRPDEYRKLKLPQGWGTWNDAVKLEVSPK
ncbi:MAG TPA: hypothetical protein DCO75_01095 [Fibrobacteres bacterium]|jgi:hypothetical protein|nr:hypothetical protein [Fibrobacterota bacterium]